MVEIPVKDMDDPRNKRTTMRVPMILPHELLDYLVVAWRHFYSHFTPFCFRKMNNNMGILRLANFPTDSKLQPVTGQEQNQHC